MANENVTHAPGITIEKDSIVGLVSAVSFLPNVLDGERLTVEQVHQLEEGIRHAKDIAEETANMILHALREADIHLQVLRQSEGLKQAAEEFLENAEAALKRHSMTH
ncbi:hypothetical protein NB640_01435 [Oxalobacter vibrioformis]|uniref:Uncharacterized protein n=1 Tax=Oxalobacter vibrioformis TaxID=933080 RepID=A0A9E9LW69_9BURK|nr:hypothetical protein [Oxalobacter vibrioformis]WAW10356.1 hypothetical protein NB640_01435 [Oxalobacter vibrioformis]